MGEIRKTFKCHIWSSYNNECVHFLLVTNLVWFEQKVNHPDAFTVTLAVSDETLREVSATAVSSSGTWTHLAHSDHNPPRAHDIYDPDDQKGLHIDVEHPHRRGYRKVYKKLAGGSPPAPTGTAVTVVADYIEKRRFRLLSDYIGE